jgi:EmrB/QacA subfamily drug resistance transporter
MAAVAGAMSVPRPSRLHGLSYEWQALIVVIVGSFMTMLDSTVVNVALPKIITVFQATINTTQLVLTAYMLALAIIMPATGYLSDTFGTKRLFLISMAFFTIGSMLCGMAWNVPSLVLFRILQGLGGGMMSPLGMTILFKVVPPERRGTIMGIFGLPLMVAPVLGPTVGGYIVEYISWRWIFTINLPIGILGLLLGYTILRETERIPNLKFDLAGFVFSGSAFALLLYGLTYGPTDGWKTAKIVLCLAGGSVLLLMWIVLELTTEQPLLDLRIFHNGTYALATGVSFVLTVGTFSSIFLLPLFLQNLRGLGAMQSGLLTFPQSIGAALMMPLSGRLFDRIGPRPLIVGGLLVMFGATWQLAGLSLETPDSTLRIILIIRGMGLGLAMMPSMTVAMNTLVGREVARGSSLTNVLRQVFSAFGTAIFSTLLSSRTTYHEAMLAWSMTPDSPPVRSTLAAVEQMVLQQGGTPAQAQIDALMMIAQEVALKAQVMSFDDCFMVGAVMALVALPISLFLRTKGTVRAGRPVPMGE